MEKLYVEATDYLPLIDFDLDGITRHFADQKEGKRGDGPQGQGSLHDHAKRIATYNAFKKSIEALRGGFRRLGRCCEFHRDIPPITELGGRISPAQE